MAFECSFPTFCIRYPNHVSEDVIKNHFVMPEQDLIEWSKQFCNQEELFLDIGAHCGTYAIQLSRFCKRVEAFECQEPTFYQLCAGIAVNACWNVHAHHCALVSPEEQNTTKTYHVVSLDGGGTSLHEQKNNQVIETGQVQAKTLDSFSLFPDHTSITSNPRVGFIKLDVEGYELNVLKGSIYTLTRNNFPVLLFESWSHDTQMRQSIIDFLTTSPLQYKTIVPVQGYPHMMLASPH